MKKMKIAVVGATGMVGTVMLKLLEERQFPITELIPVASERSVGKKVTYKGVDYTIVGLATAVEMKADIAIFSAGGDTSLEWAPKFAEAGTIVIDNSSAWRMDPTKKLVVPEINASELTIDDKIIANPNCSTIQLVMALSPLHDTYKMKRVVISTYQSVSGTGVKAVQQLENEINGVKGEMAYPYPIGRNALPHCDVFLENGYTKEEMKLAREPQKILNDRSFSITATAVRIPTSGGHSESVNVQFENDFELNDVRTLLSQFDGVTVQDNTIRGAQADGHLPGAAVAGRAHRRPDRAAHPRQPRALLEQDTEEEEERAGVLRRALRLRPGRAAEEVSVRSPW